MDSNHKDILNKLKIIIRKNISKNIKSFYDIHLPVNKIRYYNIPVPKQLFNDCGYHTIMNAKLTFQHGTSGKNTSNWL